MGWFFPRPGQPGLSLTALSRRRPVRQAGDSELAVPAAAGPGLAAPGPSAPPGPGPPAKAISLSQVKLKLGELTTELLGHSPLLALSGSLRPRLKAAARTEALTSSQAESLSGQPASGQSASGSLSARTARSRASMAARARPSSWPARQWSDWHPTSTLVRTQYGTGTRGRHWQLTAAQAGGKFKLTQ